MESRLILIVSKPIELFLLMKLFGKIFFLVKNIFGQETFWSKKYMGKKNFGPKIYDQNQFQSKENLVMKIPFLVKKFLLLVWKDFFFNYPKKIGKR